MTRLAAGLIASLAVTAVESTPAIVSAPDSPVRLDHATVLRVEGGPPVLLYAATNTTEIQLDQFTVMVFVFDAGGTLKARQVAPARRTLEARETKYSAMILDGSRIEPTDFIVAGVNQAQRVNSDSWWRAELQPAAEEAAKRQKK
jgi:hypothetical protein